MYELFVEPWTLGSWMWRGTLAGALAAIPCAMIGVFLYLRRLSLTADALTHVALPGIVAAFLLTGSIEPLPMLLGAVSMGLIASFSIESLARHPAVRSDSAVGIVFTAFFAAGVIALSVFVEDAHIDTQCVLFGDVLGVSDDTLWLLGVTSPLIVAGVLACFRWLSIVSFDEGMARNLGIPVAFVHYGLMTAASVTTVAAFEAVGAILAVAMIIVPAATAHLFADRLQTMLAVAVAHGVASAVFGMYCAIWFDVSAAGAIVCVGGMLYILAFLFAPRHGLVPRAMKRFARREVGTQSPREVVKVDAVRDAL